MTTTMKGDRIMVDRYELQFKGVTVDWYTYASDYSRQRLTDTYRKLIKRNKSFIGLPYRIVRSAAQCSHMTRKEENND